jgi:endonuclease-3
MCIVSQKGFILLAYKRLGWVNSKNPEGTRAQLEDWLPRENWKEVNKLLGKLEKRLIGIVGFGQLQCTPLRPDCSVCPVKDLCPKVGTKSKSSK